MRYCMRKKLSFISLTLIIVGGLYNANAETADVITADNFDLKKVNSCDTKPTEANVEDDILQKSKQIDVQKIIFSKKGEMPYGEVTMSERKAAEEIVEYINKHSELNIKGVKFITPPPRDGVTIDDIVNSFRINEEDEYDEDEYDEDEEADNENEDDLDDDNEVSEKDDFKENILNTINYGIKNSATFRQLLMSLSLGVVISDGYGSHQVNDGIEIDFDQTDMLKYNTWLGLSGTEGSKSEHYDFLVGRYKDISRLYTIYHELSHLYRFQVMKNLRNQNNIKDRAQAALDTQKAISLLFDVYDVNTSPLLSIFVNSLNGHDKYHGNIRNLYDVNLAFFRGSRRLSREDIVSAYKEKIEGIRKNKIKLVEFLFNNTEEINQILGIAVYDNYLYVRPTCDAAFLAEQGLPIRVNHANSIAQELKFKDIFGKAIEHVEACADLIDKFTNSSSIKNQSDSSKYYDKNVDKLIDAIELMNRMLSSINSNITSNEIDTVKSAMKHIDKLVHELQKDSIYCSKDQIDKLKAKFKVFRDIEQNSFKIFIQTCPHLFIDVTNITFDKEFLALLLRLHGVEVRNLDAYGLALDINKVGMDYKTKQLSAPLALTYDPGK